MSEESPSCPKCQSEHTYQDGNVWVCPECFNEWTSAEGASRAEDSAEAGAASYIDSNGVPLETGDTVATIKDLKMGKDTIKSGTKVKNIRLLDDPVDGHDISCKIPGHGSVYLKCSVVKKIR
jgi:protein PhnA